MGAWAASARRFARLKPARLTVEVILNQMPKTGRSGNTLPTLREIL